MTAQFFALITPLWTVAVGPVRTTRCRYRGLRLIRAIPRHGHGPATAIPTKVYRPVRWRPDPSDLHEPPYPDQGLPGITVPRPGSTGSPPRPDLGLPPFPARTRSTFHRRVRSPRWGFGVRPTRGRVMDCRGHSPIPSIRSCCRRIFRRKPRRVARSTGKPPGRHNWLDRDRHSSGRHAGSDTVKPMLEGPKR